MLEWALLSASLAACAQDVMVVRETPTGGIVAYSIKEDGDILSSEGRSQAINLIEKKCHKQFHVVREGEIPRLSKNVDKVWRGQIITDRLWGLQFTCDRSAELEP